MHAFNACNARKDKFPYNCIGKKEGRIEEQDEYGSPLADAVI